MTSPLAKKVCQCGWESSTFIPGFAGPVVEREWHEHILRSHKPKSETIIIQEKDLAEHNG